MATPIVNPKAVLLSKIMSEVMVFTSPRHVLRWIEMFCRHRAEMITAERDSLLADKKYSTDAKLAYVEKKGYPKRIRSHTLIANTIQMLLKDLDKTDPEVAPTQIEQENVTDAPVEDKPAKSKKKGK